MTSEAIYPIVSAPYLAGIIDGEGCLVVRLHNGGRSLHCSIEITNTHRGLIDAIHDQWGGNMYQKAPGSSERHQAWCIRITGPKADCVAAAVGQHLIVKRDQMGIWLRARSMMLTRGGYRSVRLTPSDHERRRCIVQEMRDQRAAEMVRL